MKTIFTIFLLSGFAAFYIPLNAKATVWATRVKICEESSTTVYFDNQKFKISIGTIDSRVPVLSSHLVITDENEDVLLSVPEFVKTNDVYQFRSRGSVFYVSVRNLIRPFRRSCDYADLEISVGF